MWDGSVIVSRELCGVEVHILTQFICFQFYSENRWSTPVIDIRRQRRLGTLGAVNPIPFVVGMFNTLGWLLYGCLLHDGYIMWANFAALGVQTYCTQSLFILLSADVVKTEYKVKEALQLMKKAFSSSETEKADDLGTATVELAKKTKLLDLVEIGLFMAPPLWGFMSWLAWVIWEDDRTYAIKVIGYICVFQTLVYFSAPLSFIKEVVRLGDASSIYPPSIVANTANCSMWLVYGFVAIKDPMVWGPNLFGLVLQVVNTFLVIWYPRKIAKFAAEKLAKDLVVAASEKLNTSLDRGVGEGSLSGRLRQTSDTPEVEVHMAKL